MDVKEQLRFNARALFVILLAFVCLFAGMEGCGRAKPKMYRVGILSGLEYMAATADGFKEMMAELGYVEDKNIIYDLQKTDFDMDVYEKILNKFILDKVDLIFVFPTEASLEAKAAAAETGIPVVFAVANIEDTGLVQSVQQPGGNITGVRYPGPDLAIKRFEIMLELAPRAKRIWIPYQRGYPIVESQLKVLRPVAAAAGITLIEAPASSAAEIRAELEERTQSADIGMDAILFISEPLAVTPEVFAVIGKFAAEHNLPVGGALMRSGEYETIFGVNINTVNTGKQAAKLADKVLQGTPAGMIPVVSSENYFQINYKAAKKLGLDVDEGLLSMADEVIR